MEKNKFQKNIFTEVLSEKEKNKIIEKNVNENIINESSTEKNNKSNKENNIENDLSGLSPKTKRKIQKIKSIISQNFVNIEDLKNICWQGLPYEDNSIRAECWKYLLGLYPLNTELLNQTTNRKKQEYNDMCNIYLEALNKPEEIMNEEELKIYRQILKDVPRTMPEFSMFQCEKIKFMLTRVLYIWSLRHPASGYVQGFNDLCIPFFIVFFLEKFPNKNIDSLINMKSNEFDILDESAWLELETNIYYSLTKLLDRIQTNYTHDQPGITSMIRKMELIVQKVDKDLHEHLKKFEIDYLQFCFRWMNCFLLREFPLNLILRLWDTYFSEDKGFAEFHLYVCACLLLTFSETLKLKNDFQELIVFLQNLPTSNWNQEDIDTLLAKSYSIKQLYSNSNIFKEEPNK